MHNFNFEDLVQYMYRDTSDEKMIAISTALQTDWCLREKYEMLKEGQFTLGTSKLSPRKKTIDAILDYAERSVSGIATGV